MLVDLLVAHANLAQDAALQLGLVDTNGAAAHLEAVHDDVVGVASAGKRIALDLVEVLVAHARERMMLGGVALLVLVVAEHREVHDPAQVMRARLDEVHGMGHVQTHVAKHLVDDARAIGTEHDEVARLDVERRLDRLDLIFGEELGDGAVDLALAAELNPGHALGAPLESQIAQLVDLRARPVARALGVDGLDDAAIGERAGEDLEAAVLDDIGDVDELHAKTAVRTVGAIAGHGLGVGHAIERETHVVDPNGLEDLGEHVFHHVHDVVFGDKGHLDVDLGELGLTVGA